MINKTVYGKNNFASPDDSQININDSGNVCYAATTLGLSPDQVIDAIKEVGSSKIEILDYLKKTSGM